MRGRRGTLLFRLCHQPDRFLGACRYAKAAADAPIPVYESDLTIHRHGLHLASLDAGFASAASALIYHGIIV
jgi:hypothetical protein